MIEMKHSLPGVNRHPTEAGRNMQIGSVASDILK